MPRQRSWTDDQLREAVAASTTLAEIHHRLGLRPGKYASMLKHIERLGLPYEHLTTVRQRSGARQPYRDVLR